METGGEIRIDLPCPRCTYNLRSLRDGGRCPECGFIIDLASWVRLTRAVRPALSVFDKICVVVAFPVAAFLLMMGLTGFFAGCWVSFELPPILGVLPALVGWGILRSAVVAWRSGKPPKIPAPPRTLPSIYRDPIPVTIADLDAEIARKGTIPLDAPQDPPPPTP